MFHEGQYLEVIKVSDNCLATVIVTVKEKMVKIDKEKISTNKWLSLDDWYELYKIIQKAILRNSKASKERCKLSKISERKKSTKRLDIVYTIEPPDDIKNKNSLSTIKVRVSPTKRTSRVTSQSSSINNKKSSEEKRETDDGITSTEAYKSVEARVQHMMRDIDSYDPEEYVPADLANRQRVQDNLKYVPSRKSLLKQLKQFNESNSNEYSPILSNKQTLKSNDHNVNYIPNPISSLEKINNHEVYDPCGMTSIPVELSEAYVPSSKGLHAIVEEYQPDFAIKSMKFDTSYVPSLKRPIDQDKIHNTAKKKIRKECEVKVRKKLSSSSKTNSNKKQLNSKREL